MSGPDMKVVVLLIASRLVTAYASVLPPSLTDVLRLSVSNMAQWHKVATEDGEFSIFIPAEPRIYREQSVSYETDNTERRLQGQICGVALPGMAFIVEFYDAKDPKQALATLLNYRHDVQTFERDVSLNGFHGKQYRGYWKDLYSNIQYFISSKRIYVIHAIARNGNSPAVSEFWSSLRLNTIDKRADVSPAPPNYDAELLPTVNTDNQVFKGTEVTRKAIAVWKPSPTYSSEALNKNLKGTVLLQAVFSSSGYVTNVEVLKGLGKGLDEKAIEVAKSILFIPAEKDGVPVSQYMKLEYNFDTGL